MPAEPRAGARTTSKTGPGPGPLPKSGRACLRGQEQKENNLAAPQERQPCPGGGLKAGIRGALEDRLDGAAPAPPPHSCNPSHLLSTPLLRWQWVCLGTGRALELVTAHWGEGRQLSGWPTDSPPSNKHLPEASGDAWALAWGLPQSQSASLGSVAGEKVPSPPAPLLFSIPPASLAERGRERPCTYWGLGLHFF